MSRDRRRHIRAPLQAHVMLFAAHRCFGSFRVLNLSAGGLLVAGTAPRAGKGKLSLILELPGTRLLRAEVTLARPLSRKSPQPLTEAPAFALAFTRISASGQDAIQDTVLGTLEEAQAANVLIATAAVGEGLALKRAFDRLGRASFCVNAAAEVLRFFELRNRVSMALIDEAFAAGPQTRLLQQLADQQPKVLRVLLSAQDTTLHAEAEEVLAQPWLEEDLLRLLGLRTMLRPFATAG
jgi:hypothetical protein